MTPRRTAEERIADSSTFTISSPAPTSLRAAREAAGITVDELGAADSVCFL